MKPHWTDSWPSRCLGGLGPTLYFIPEDYGQIITYSAGQLQKNNLMMLALIEWYKVHFPYGKGVWWDGVVDAIVSESKKIGTNRPGRLRGRGFWRDDDKPLIHLGDRLLPPHGKKYVPPETYTEGGRIYPQLPHLEGPARKILPVRSSRWVLSLFESLLWENAVSAALCAGWTVLAPLSGFLLWRPHIWLTGVAGCGKTTVLRDIIVPLLGGMGLYAEGSGTTEAGLRRQLKCDALPVVIDEAEADSKAARGRVEAIIRMMRSSASTSAKVFKGTQGGKGMNFEIRSMFCLGAVGGAPRAAVGQAAHHDSATAPSGHPGRCRAAEPALATAPARDQQDHAVGVPDARGTDHGLGTFGKARAIARGHQDRSRDRPRKQARRRPVRNVARRHLHATRRRHSQRGGSIGLHEGFGTPAFHGGH